MNNLPINEFFYSIQGEGFFTGKPAFFIRLQGCDVGCAFCDTKYSWFCDLKNKVSQEEILNKNHSENDKWSFFTVLEIFNLVKKNYPQCNHIIITGGEPCIYNLLKLIEQFEDNNFTVQIETSGTYKAFISDKTWLTLSPKIDMPSSKKVLDENIKRANEIKMPVGKIKDIEKLQNLLDLNLHKKDISIYLQPLSGKEKPTNLCFEYCLKNNWNLSIQVHRLINFK